MKERIKYRFRVIKNIFPYTDRVRMHWLLLLVVGSGIAGADVLLPKLYRFFIDKVILGTQLEVIWIVITGYLFLFCAKVLMGFLKKITENHFKNTTVYNIRAKILGSYFQVTFSEYEKMNTGDLKLRLDDDTNKMYELLIPQSIDYIMAYVVAIVCGTAILHINGLLAVFSFFSIPLTFKLDAIISKKEKVISDKRRENHKNESTWLHDSIAGWQEIKALNLGRYQKKLFFRFLHTDMLLNAKWINYWTARALIIPMIKNEFFMQFGLYLIGGLLIFSGKLTIGEVLVISLYFSMFADAIQQISTADADLQADMPYIDRLMMYLEAEMVEPADRKRGEVVEADNRQREQLTEKAAKMWEPASGVICLENVSFCYPGLERTVFHNLNLTVSKGERVAIIGKSGCGKTTLLKLITGMLVPTAGQIYFSGVNLAEIDLEAMHNRVGYVMQENVLFHTTIRENILLGNEKAAESDIWTACRKACIYDFIKGLPEGLDTVIGERGIKLSGGQRQRIVLARTFLRDVDIYIFDEATSALDEYSESIVQEAIQNIGDDKTIIVVSHRKSSLKLCNRVVNLGGLNSMNC